jgi:hypothetical protein
MHRQLRDAGMVLAGICNALPVKYSGVLIANFDSNINEQLLKMLADCWLAYAAHCLWSTRVCYLVIVLIQKCMDSWWMQACCWLAYATHCLWSTHVCYFGCYVWIQMYTDS